MSPTQRSLKYLRERGYTAEVVERWIPGANVRRDLFGFIDIVAVKVGFPCLGVQATTASNMSARRAKVMNNEAAKVWCRSGNAALVMGWEKRGPRGRRKLWTVVASDLTDDLRR